MRQSWPDRRLDEFRESAERRLDRIDGRLDAIDQRFEMFEDQVKEGFSRVDNDLREIRIQLASFQRMSFQLCIGTVVTVAIGFAGLMLTHF